MTEYCRRNCELTATIITIVSCNDYCLSNCDQYRSNCDISTNIVIRIMIPLQLNRLRDKLSDAVQKKDDPTTSRTDGLIASRV